MQLPMETFLVASHVYAAVFTLFMVTVSFANADFGPNATLPEGSLCLGPMTEVLDQEPIPNMGPLCAPGLRCVYMDGTPARNGTWWQSGIGYCVKEGQICPHGVQPTHCPQDCNVFGQDCDSESDGWACYADVCNNCWRRMFYSWYHWPIVEAKKCELLQAPPYPCLKLAKISKSCYVNGSFCQPSCVSGQCLKNYRSGRFFCNACNKGYKLKNGKCSKMSWIRGH